MNAVVRSEMFLLLLAGALIVMSALQSSGNVDFINELHKVI